LNNAIFGLAEEIEAALEKQIKSKRQTSNTVGEDAVVDVAAAGVIASERRRLFPRFTAASRILIVAIRERLMGRDPKALNEKQREKPPGDALREVEVESTKAGESMGHQRDEQTHPV
jgi:hypothetical protein